MSIKTQIFYVTNEKQRDIKIDKSQKFTYYTVCILYAKRMKKKRLKKLLLEVQVLCPGELKNSCERGSPCISMFDFFSYKNQIQFFTQKYKKVKFKLIRARSSCTTWCEFCIKNNEKENDKNFVARSSSALPEKVQKFL